MLIYHLMKNVIDTTLVETAPYGSGAEETTEETIFPRQFTPEPNSEHGAVPPMQWSWACRKLGLQSSSVLEDFGSAPPRAGDVALVRVEKSGFHKYLITADNRRLRLYPGAHFTGVFGNRYASDAYEGTIQGLDNLNMLTAAGMIGTVLSKHSTMAEPTELSLVGFMSAEEGKRLNLKQRLFRPTPTRRLPRNLIYIVGTSMNAGKTTTATRLIRGLCDLGVRVAACKLTGSVSNRDQDELAAAASQDVIDFSDFGFPSTYLCSREELMVLFHAMLAEVSSDDPDVVIMELADGLVQRETAMLLAEPEIKQSASGLILSADSALAALWGTERLRKLGYQVLAVSGKFTSSPLMMREYSENDSNIPVLSSVGKAEELSARVRTFLKK